MRRNIVVALMVFSVVVTAVLVLTGCLGTEKTAVVYSGETPRYDCNLIT